MWALKDGSVLAVGGIILSPNSIMQAQSAGANTIVQISELPITSVTQDQLAEDIAFYITHIIDIDNVTQSYTVSAPTLEQVIQLAVSSLHQHQAVDRIVFELKGRALNITLEVREVRAYGEVRRPAIKVEYRLPRVY